MRRERAGGHWNRSRRNPTGGRVGHPAAVRQSSTREGPPGRMVGVRQSLLSVSLRCGHARATAAAEFALATRPAPAQRLYRGAGAAGGVFRRGLRFALVGCGRAGFSTQRGHANATGAECGHPWPAHQTGRGWHWRVGGRHGTHPSAYRHVPAATVRAGGQYPVRTGSGREGSPCRHRCISARIPDDRLRPDATGSRHERGVCLVGGGVRERARLSARPFRRGRRARCHTVAGTGPDR